MKGSYLLVLTLTDDSLLTVGRLGTFEFPAGFYLYIGSALNGLEGRIGRHLRRDKKLHWHIDYLTAVAQVEQVWRAGSAERLECRWATKVIESGAIVPAPGFGASDCRCPTHLLRVGNKREIDRVRQLLEGSLPSGVGLEAGPG